MPNNPFKSEKLSRSVGGFVFMPPATDLTDFFTKLTELLTRLEQMFYHYVCSVLVVKSRTQIIPSMNDEFISYIKTA